MEALEKVAVPYSGAPSFFKTYLTGEALLLRLSESTSEMVTGTGHEQYEAAKATSSILLSGISVMQVESQP